MAGTDKMRLPTKVLEQAAKQPPVDNVFDTELPGFHVRSGRRGLTFRLFYRGSTIDREITSIRS